MYISAGFFNILLKEFENIKIDIQRMFSEFETDLNILESPLEKIDTGILGRYFERLVEIKKNNRIGLETGFKLPFIVTASIFNICRDYKTVRELFATPFEFEHPTANNIHKHSTRVEDDVFYFEIDMNTDFVSAYPIAARQWIEMQYGIALQYAYSFSGRYVHPVFAHSIYPQEDEPDKLVEYLGCPVKFSENKFALAFDKSVLDIPIVTASRDLLSAFENYMLDIRDKSEYISFSENVRRFILQNITDAELSLKLIAEKFNMSERSVQRRLKEEGSTYRNILDGVRIELSKKYLKKNLRFAEIAVLLGFESQSAFNKFFRKHFGATPNDIK